ncbi:MAG TPA: adenylyl-sulfate kinase [Solirubrobacteraceae bacterium]|jgi:adenylyl-sulfate kinase|nr:adenylyl-sulfate kinase [Solirubrobacteraceae bacterium]
MPDEHRPNPADEGLVLWLTGLSSAGKSTLSRMAATRLRERGHRVEVIDGDLIRERLSPDLGFSRTDRDENVRRVTVISDLLSRNGVIVLAAMISPFREARARARAELRARFVEVYVKASVEACAKRDPKGLYAKALGGQIGEFTGISDPYEEPLAPELVLDTEHESKQQCVARILEYVDARLRVPA